MRTICLRQNSTGDWFVTVQLKPSKCISHVGYPTRAQALRAFINEGREQPYSRMTVHSLHARSGVVIRERGGLPRKLNADPAARLQTNTVLDLLGS